MRGTFHTSGDPRSARSSHSYLSTERLNQTYQLRPRDHQIHLIKKDPLARALGDQSKSGGGKADLFHKRSVAQSKLSVLSFADHP